MNNDGHFEDIDLLARFHNESTRNYAFNLLVRKYQQRLYWQIRRIVIDHDDSHDILQNVFIKVWKSLEKFRKEAHLHTWLYRIAVNEALSFLKQKKRRAHVPIDSVNGELSEYISSDVHFSGDKIQMKLQQAILTLPDQQRIIFNMKYYDDLKYEEISTILNLTVGGLKASYHHAVKKIEKFISEN